MKRLLIGVVAAVAVGLVGAPVAQAGDITCDTQRHSVPANVRFSDL